MSSIIDIDDLKSYMVGKTLDDGLAQQIVDGANAWVERQTGRRFGDSVQITERYRWANVVWLRRMDVVSVDEVKLGFPNQVTSVVDPSGYYLDPLGRITFYSYANGNGSRLYNDYLSIKYTYGTADVPDDLKMALLGIASGMYTWAINENRDVVGVSVGSYQVQYAQKRGNAAPDSATSGADAAWSVILSYKLRRL